MTNLIHLLGITALPLLLIAPLNAFASHSLGVLSSGANATAKIEWPRMDNIKKFTGSSYW